MIPTPPHPPRPPTQSQYLLALGSRLASQYPNQVDGEHLPEGPGGSRGSPTLVKQAARSSPKWATADRSSPIPRKPKRNISPPTFQEGEWGDVPVRCVCMCMHAPFLVKPSDTKSQLHQYLSLSPSTYTSDANHKAISTL